MTAKVLLDAQTSVEQVIIFSPSQDLPIPGRLTYALPMIIEVISRPPGQSPDWVRDVWIGMRLRTVRDEVVSAPTVTMQKGQSSRLWLIWQTLRGKAEVRRGYLVNAKEAVGLMALQNEDAARWCIENTPLVLDPAQVIMFEEHCCRPVAAT